jgi:hypothetical protein
VEQDSGSSPRRGAAAMAVNSRHCGQTYRLFPGRP